MITHKSCPVCGSFNITAYHKTGASVHKLPVIPGVEIDTTVHAYYSLCRDCRLIFQNPRFSDEELNRYYQEGHYRRLLRTVEEESCTDEGEKHRAEFDAKAIKSLIGKVASHLDVGCGRGYFLDAIGADVRVGVESDQDYVKVKNIKLYKEMSEISKKTFDFVSALHVLEHVPYPLEFLKEMKQFLSDESFLMVEVPTWKSSGGPLRLSHLYHFETDVLKLICKQIGLQVIETIYTPHLIIICKKNTSETHIF